MPSLRRLSGREVIAGLRMSITRERWEERGKEG